MLRKFFKERKYCGLDIGTRTVKAAVVNLKSYNNVELIGVQEDKTYGFDESHVNDMGAFSECIHQILHQLMKNTKVKIRDVQVGIGSNLINVRKTSTAIPLTEKGNKVISRNDIKKVNDQSRLLGVKIDEEVIHSLSHSYEVDDMNGVVHPLGLYGRKLGVSSYLMVSQENRIRNITKSIHQAGFDVGNVFFDSYVSSINILSEEERSLGCAFVDIGAQKTNVFIYKDGCLRCFNTIDLGGISFSEGIASHLDIPLDLAEEIKKSHATALLSERFHREEILIKRESNYFPIKRSVIFQSIDPIIEKFISELLSVFEGSGCYDQIPKGIVLIGGGALLTGLIERITESLHLPARIGHNSFCSVSKESKNPHYASVINVAVAGHFDTVQYTVQRNGHVHWLGAMTDRVRELYQEYF